MYIYEVVSHRKGSLCTAEVPDLNETIVLDDPDDISVLEQVAHVVKTVLLKILLTGEEVPKPTLGHKADKVFVLALDVPLPEDDMFSIEDAMGILKVTQPRVSHLIRDGRLIAVKQGRRRWITRDSMEAYLRTPRTAGRPSRSQAHMFDYARKAKRTN